MAKKRAAANIIEEIFFMVKTATTADDDCGSRVSYFVEHSYTVGSNKNLIYRVDEILV
jgi:hypothetical protein